MMSNRSNLTRYTAPPVNDKQVAWVKQNIAAIEQMISVPEKTQDHKALIAAEITKLFILYSTPVDRAMSEERLRQEIARRQIIAEAFLADLTDYPVWAVFAGLQRFRKSPESKWAPKTPGELIVHIGAEIAAVRRTHDACQKIIRANELGRNVDCMRERIENRTGKEQADAALEIMDIIAKSCDPYVDPVAATLHRDCYRIFHDWRKKNPLPKVEGINADQA